MPADVWEGDPAPDEDDEGDAVDARVDPRLWFLRDPEALARRYVLSEIVATPPGRERVQAMARRRG
jgi:hypothetical protein